MIIHSTIYKHMQGYLDFHYHYVLRIREEEKAKELRGREACRISRPQKQK